MRYIKIPMSGKVEVMEEPTALPDLQGIVGGYIEGVFIDNQHVLLVNENRFINNLMPNPRASMLANRVICGDVVLTGPPTPEGDDGAIEPHIAEFILGSVNT